MKAVLFTLFGAFILILAGCTLTGDGIVDLDGPTCNAPYIVHGSSCCLDKNDNDICDTDETRKAETIVRERPVILIEETCSLPRFTCIDKEITGDYVKLLLRFDRDEKITIKSMKLTDLRCEETYEDLQLEYNDQYEFKIPCVIEEDAVKTQVLTNAEITGIMRHSNGQIFNYGTPTQADIKGSIGGIVER